MLVIAADTHKSTHAVAAVDEATGRLVAEQSFGADRAGMLALLRWAHRCGPELVFALEDCRHLSGRLERCLVSAGERVVRVAPQLTGPARRTEREPGKSDAIDARAVARAALERGVDALPAAALDPPSLAIRLLADHRAALVAERTRSQTRLRWHLVELDAELEARVPTAALRRAVWVDRLAAALAAMPAHARVRVARAELDRIRALNATVSGLDRELRQLVAAEHPQLLSLPGCGAVAAATLIGRTAGAHRFPTDGHFARQAGVAPVPEGSGRRQRRRLNRGGDRQLNAALHRIAVTQARCHPEAQAYLARKQAEGKNRREALRCLKRHLARRVWHLLRDDPRTDAEDRGGRAARAGSRAARPARRRAFSDG